MNELVEITLRSLMISGGASVIGASISIPLTLYIYSRGGRVSNVYASLVNALTGFPTVLIGLLLYFLLSERGFLGGLNLLYTPVAMMIGQAVLISPLIASSVYEVVKSSGGDILELAEVYRASYMQKISILASEFREGLMGSVVIGFQRAIGELGVALMLGGNIKGFTRVFTTAIALEIHKGEFELAISLGITLLVIDLIIMLILRLVGRWSD